MTEPRTVDPTEPWGSNASMDEIVSRLREAESAVLLTHGKPDGDAVGSAVGIARALIALGKKAIILFDPPWTDRFDCVIGDTPHRVLKDRADDEAWQDQQIESADTVVVVDTGSWTQLGASERYLRARRDRVVLIDHHAHGDSEVAAMRYVDTQSPAAAQIVAEIARRVLGLERIAELPLPIASAVYLGMATDTGWFKHPSVRSSTFRIVADLIDAGVEHTRLFLETEQSDPPERLLLMQRAMKSMELVAGVSAAVMCLSPADFQETGADLSLTGGLVDLPKAVRTVEVSVLLTQIEPHLSKVSFRSKASKRCIDVNELAQRFGGGGHKHAAGARIDADLPEAKAQIIAALEDALR
jgi:bifunctional oligoribonuclease and PAP phosphatase NrnA